MTTSTLFVWKVSNDTQFEFPFKATDAPGSGIASWQVQTRPIQGGEWDTVASGTGGGSLAPLIAGEEGSIAAYRVRLTDKQGNVATSSRNRGVIVPWDDDNLGAISGSFVGGTVVADDQAWGGTFHELAVGDSFSVTITDPDAGESCRQFHLVGPGDGDWSVSVGASGEEPSGTLHASNVEDGHGRILDSAEVCNGSASLVFTVTSGSGFGIDAVVG